MGRRSINLIAHPAAAATAASSMHPDMHQKPSHFQNKENSQHYHQRVPGSADMQRDAYMRQRDEQGLTGFENATLQDYQVVADDQNFKLNRQKSMNFSDAQQRP